MAGNGVVGPAVVFGSWHPKIKSERKIQNEI